MEGVAVFLLGVDGLHTGFYHAGYFIMSISAMRGFALGGEEIIGNGGKEGKKE